ncbi:MAG TPA: hypothetical protein VEC60_03340, partial [Reyranella sp.]|nr:hypothetical protein [Reyranella sp.]
KAAALARSASAAAVAGCAAVFATGAMPSTARLINLRLLRGAAAAARRLAGWPGNRYGTAKAAVHRLRGW